MVNLPYGWSLGTPLKLFFGSAPMCPMKVTDHDTHQASSIINTYYSKDSSCINSTFGICFHSFLKYSFNKQPNFIIMINLNYKSFYNNCWLVNPLSPCLWLIWASDGLPLSWLRARSWSPSLLWPDDSSDARWCPASQIRSPEPPSHPLSPAKSHVEIHLDTCHMCT